MNGLRTSNESRITPLLSSRQVARWLGISPRTVCLWAELDEIPAFKLGHQWRFREADVRIWVETRRGRVAFMNSRASYVLCVVMLRGNHCGSLEQRTYWMAMGTALGGLDTPPMVTTAYNTAEEGRFEGRSTLIWKNPERFSGDAPA
jgi:excisionase family DNA binding protein